MIEVKAPITGWHPVTREQALRWAAVKYEGMQCPNPIERINDKIRGVQFDADEIKDAIKGVAHA